MGRALKLSEAVSIALHAMGLIASRNGDTVPTRTIVDRFGVSEAHLSKVLQRLVKVGLLSSIRGPKGGFSLTREPSTVRLLEVYEAVEGPFEPNNCMFNMPLCDGVSCILGTTLADANERLRRYLSETTVADIIPIFHRESSVLIPGRRSV